MSFRGTAFFRSDPVGWSIVVNITRGLLDILLEMAEEAEPQSVTIHLAVSDASELGLTDELDADTAVFSDFYLPSSGDSIEAVFGMDVSVPPGQTPGLFTSHPEGRLEVHSRDEFAERIIIAVPPWTTDAVADFDRRGREHELHIVDVATDIHPESETL